MNRICFFLIPCILLAITGRAQPNQSLQIQSQPNTTDLESGSNIYNVNLTNGALNVSVPIHGYQSKNFKLSNQVKLSFDGSGMKVNDVASQVGLNWHLDVGGEITREINGIPDEAATIGFANSSPLPTSPSIANLQDIAKSFLDGQLDVYTFRAGQYSGKFVIGKDGSVKTLPVSNIRILKRSPTNQPLGSSFLDSVRSHTFTIIVPDGTVYDYELYNCIKMDYFLRQFNYDQQKKYASTKWYLTKITAPVTTNKQINFQYQLTTSTLFIDPLVNLFQYTPINVYPGNKNFCDKCDRYPNCDDTYLTTVSNFHREYVPLGITYPNGDKIEFVYEKYRPDQNDKTLDKINITNNFSNKKKTFVLEHHKTNRSIGGIMEGPMVKKGSSAYDQYMMNIGMDYYNNAHKNSILLTSIFEIDEATNAKLPGYIFNYEPGTLPPIGSKGSIDLWGYYCGTGNITNGPEIGAFDFNNRMPDFWKAQIKSLKSITLPTGGEVQFDYELNTVGNDYQYPVNPSGLRVSKVKRRDGITNNIVQKTYKYTKENGTSSGFLFWYPVFEFAYDEGPGGGQFYTSPVRNCEGFQEEEWYWNWNSPYSWTHKYMFEAKSRTALNKTVASKSKNVEYKRVEVLSGTENNYIEKNVYEFTIANDFGYVPNNSTVFPFVPYNEFSYKTGLIKKLSQYSANNTLMSQKTYEYDYVDNANNNPNFNSLKVGVKVNGAANSSLSDFVAVPYMFHSGISFLKKTITTDYFAGNKSTTDEVEYEYDPVQLVPLKIKSRNEHNDLVEKRFKYPFQYNNSVPAVGMLNSYGINRFPLAIEDWNISKDVLLKAQANQYSAEIIDINNVTVRFHLSKQYILTPKDINTAQLWGAHNPGVLLNRPGEFIEDNHKTKYDISGNVIEEKSKGITKSYIYGNNNSQLIAEVYNAEASDIAYTSFENAQSQGGWTWGGPGIIQQNFKLTGNSSFFGINLPGGMIDKSGLNSGKTYIVSFWGKGALPPTIVKNGSTAIIPEIMETYQDWTLYKCRLEGATEIRITVRPGNYLDELRLYPENAMMATKCYEPLWNVPLSECGADNRFINYEYDQFGRFKLSRDMEGNIINVREYAPQEVQN